MVERSTVNTDRRCSSHLRDGPMFFLLLLKIIFNGCKSQTLKDINLSILSNYATIGVRFILGRTDIHVFG